MMFVFCVLFFCVNCCRLIVVICFLLAVSLILFVVPLLALLYEFCFVSLFVFVGVVCCCLFFLSLVVVFACFVFPCV